MSNAATRDLSKACGYHPGERDMQRRAGLATEADRVAQLVQPAITPAGELFLSIAELVVLATRDDRGRCWVTHRRGQPGFIRTSPDRVHIIGGAHPNDPATRRRFGDPVGALIIDMPKRRRFRVNGTIVDWTDYGITMNVREAYSNCPKYIDPTAQVVTEAAPFPSVTCTRALTATQVDWVSSATFFFIGSSHPSRGADASHRGGPAGFVHVYTSILLAFPDYTGNAMFNTLGNLLVDPRVGLLFLDKAKRKLQVTGEACIESGAATPQNPTGRTAVVHVHEVVESRW